MEPEGQEKEREEGVPSSRKHRRQLTPTRVWSRHNRSNTAGSATSLTGARQEGADVSVEDYFTGSRRASWGSSKYSSAFSPKDDGDLSAIFGAVSWVPDAIAPSCYKCHTEFGFSGWKRISRHHCRTCGNCFCFKCTTKRMQLRKGEKPVRVCDDCYEDILAYLNSQEEPPPEPSSNQSSRSLEMLVDNPDEATRVSGQETDVSSDWNDFPNFDFVNDYECAADLILPDPSFDVGDIQLDGDGEIVVDVLEDVWFEFTQGDVYLTTFQLILRKTPSPLVPGKKNIDRNMVKIPFLAMERLEISLNESHDAGIIDVFCKNFRFVRLVIFGMVSLQRFTEFHKLEHHLVTFAFPGEEVPYHHRFRLVSEHPVVKQKLPQNYFATFSACCLQAHHDDKLEHQRLIRTSNAWRVSSANESFALCSSYPRYLVVPASISDRDLFQVADFRCRRRIPVLSWRDPATDVVLVRSSQPRVGILRSRSASDEKLIASIVLASRSDGLIFLDARPVVNATVNKVTTSGGFEDVANYNDMLMRMHSHSRVSIEFMDVQNKNSVRTSLHKVRQLVCHNLKKKPVFQLSFGHSSNAELVSSIKILQANTDDDFEINWLMKFAESRWHEHLAYILRAAVRVVSIIKNENKSVAVHCSDGWDRTPQVVSLAMLLMDPHYRTLTGFITLIEKEWISFGHPFRKRNAIGDPSEVNTAKGIVRHSNSHVSPIFLQFIECVWQILLQFPTAFEFNEDMLILILDRMYDCRHGNFLVNNRQESAHYRLPLRATCLWTEVLENRPNFINTAFSPCSDTLFPGYSTKALQFWQAYFLRFDETCVDSSFKKQVVVESYSSSKPSSLDLRKKSLIQRKPSIILVQPDSDLHYFISTIIDTAISDAVITSLTRELDRHVA